MSKAQLARLTGMTRQGLIKIENGGNVSLGGVILQALGVRWPTSSRARIRGNEAGGDLLD
jgi:hypothetical protein